jgi:hypothetical protein
MKSGRKTMRNIFTWTDSSLQAISIRTAHVREQSQFTNRASFSVISKIEGLNLPVSVMRIAGKVGEQHLFDVKHPGVGCTITGGGVGGSLLK